jgi:hypothetical protein
MIESSNQGLLSKASHVRDSEGLVPTPDAEGDWGSGMNASGIDAKDRAEISARLNELTRKSRINAEPSTFVVKAKKKGVLMPVVVNLATILGVALAVFFLVRVFGKEEAETAENGVALQSTEGKLIAELKKESASQLDAKDRQIAEIQQRMAELDRQKNDLTLSMEARIKAREGELKATMAVEIEAERQRLLAQGLSEAAVQDRIRKFEAEKNAEYSRQIAAFQKQAEAERSAEEARLAAVRAEYEANMAGLADERKKIQAEAQRREESLRASLDAKAASMAAENAQNLAGLEAAKAELARLEDQKKKAAGADEKVAALYASVKKALDEKRYADAALQAAALRSYLDDPEVLALSSMAARRQADVFASESLGELARIQLDRASVDTGKLLRQAELLQSIQNAVAEGRKLADSGDRRGAEARYNEALSLVPDIMAAHSYFLSRSDADNAKRTAALLDSLSAANDAYRARDYAAVAARYEDALAFLPISAEERHDLVSRVMEAGSDASDKARRTSQSKAAKSVLDQSQRDLKAGNWEKAYAGFLSILEGFPSSEQAAAAARGARGAFDGMMKETSTGGEESRKQAAELQARVDELTKQVEAASIAKDEAVRLARTEDAETLRGLMAVKDKAIADLEAALKQAQEQSLASQGGTGGTAAQAASADTAATIAALKAENDRLQDAAARYDAILSAYRNYFPGTEGQAARAQDATQVYGNLMAFLADPATDAAFPGLASTVKGLFLELRTSTATASTRDEVDICLRFVDIMKNYPAQADRDRELKALESEYSRQPTLLALIREMERKLGVSAKP